VTRVVTLVLVDGSGRPLGALPPYEVATPWWQEVAEVVAGARLHHEVDVTVLRLLVADRTAPPGGHVTYVASVRDLPGGTRLAPVDVDLSPHPRRSPWAEPGGPESSLAWAASALAAAGRPLLAATQRRTWNLSTIWRLDTRTGPVWLKQVPWFFAHEAAVLHWLGAVAPGVAPVPVAADTGPANCGRMLLDDIPGTDRYDAAHDEQLAMLVDLHRVQVLAADRVPELLALGVPDRRSLRTAALDACGLPDTLVHGDFHPGNTRGTADRRMIIDWGDSVVGHPAIDLLRMCEVAARPDELRTAWCALWRAAVPASDPERAVALMRPVAAQRNAEVYAGFIDAIEPSEWPYHASDVEHWRAQATHTP